ncbi:MAG: site-specific integrase [Gammaproteobacteria bacterium]
MAILRIPLKRDPPGKCGRWRVILYNPMRRKQEWVTVRGTKRDAETVERELKEKLSRHSYVSKSDRMTVAAVAESFLGECSARNRRTSTVLNYRSVLKGYLLPAFGHREVGTLQKKELKQWFSQLLKAGSSVALVNRIIRAFKTLLFYAITELEVLDRNILMRFKQYERGLDSQDRRMNRGAYTEAEVRALLAVANARERALVGMLCFTGIRPGEAYALRERDLDLAGGAVSVCRNWDWRGKQFTPPKTQSGRRTVALSGWLVKEIKRYLGDRPQEPDALLFGNRNGLPLNPSNVRRDIWRKLVTRARVRSLDMYSLRHTFASLGRVAGEEAFNVARAMGHSRSRLVDDVYAHALPSGMASVAQRVTDRALGNGGKLRLEPARRRSGAVRADASKASERKAER